MFSRQLPEAERLAGGRDWARAKELIQPYLEIPEIQDEARRIFTRLDADETSYRERTACIDKQAHELMEAKRLEEAAALLVNAHAEFPEIERFGALLAQVQSNIEIEKEARLLDETERSVRDLARQNQLAEALARLDRALAGRPGVYANSGRSSSLRFRNRKALRPSPAKWTDWPGSSAARMRSGP